MRLRIFLRRMFLALACAAALAAAPREGREARADAPRIQALTSVAESCGGWTVRHLNACALAVGLVIGGAFGMPINPLGGATAIAVGLGIAIFTCG